MTAGGDPDLNRLRWRCRRGLRELDVLLERYLAERWPTAPAEHQAAFRTLLELPDPELEGLILGRCVTSVSVITRLVAEITEMRARELSPRQPVYNPGSGRTDRTEREP